MREKLSKNSILSVLFQRRSFCAVSLQGVNLAQLKISLSLIWIVVVCLIIIFLSSLSGLSSSLSFKSSSLLFTLGKSTSAQLFSGAFVVVILLMSIYGTVSSGLLFGIGLSILLLTLSSFLCFSMAWDTTLMGLFLFSGIGAIAFGLVGLMLSGFATIGLLTLGQSRPLALGINLFISVCIAAVSDNVWAGMIAAFISVLGSYVGVRSFIHKNPFSWMLDIVVSVVTIGGVSFRKADLTEVDFSNSSLRYVNFQDANLTRTKWFHAKGLEFSRLKNTYLVNPLIRQLVVTLDGAAQNYDGLDLTGVYLQNAMLQETRLVGANLNGADLRNADLSRAMLKQTQLDGTDLRGAILTGAYIEDWGITSTTKLENVQCDYVYMRVPTPDNPNPLRKPDNLRQTFADGEFAEFIQPFFDTLDLYHSQDVDPRAISIALKNLSDNHPDDRLQFIAMERRGDGLNLRFSTQSSASKSELSHEYFTNYTQIKNELPAAIQMQLAEQNAEIRTLKGTIEQFIQTGTHHSTVQAETIQVIQGELIMTENRAININAGDNANITGLSSGDGVLNLGTISGSVTNAINQLPDPLDSEPLNLKTLLSELQAVIQDDDSLSDPDKSDLLEQVQALAEAKQAEEPTKREGITRKAMKMFDATLKSLPATASIVEACGKLLPLILRALGMPG